MRGLHGNDLMYRVLSLSLLRHSVASRRVATRYALRKILLTPLQHWDRIVHYFLNVLDSLQRVTVRIVGDWHRQSL